MQVSKLSFDKFSALSTKDVTYQLQSQKLSEFIADEPNLAGFEHAIERRKKFPVDRTLLVDTLRENYQGISNAIQAANIESLQNEDTFTIITAHQPCVLGGPAFYIYKICSTINLCARLKDAFPSYNFVPVFISGSEDHDFAEVKSIKLFGKELTWETSQSGSVGRFEIQELEQIIQQFEELVGTSPNALRLTTAFKTAFEGSKTYNQFVFLWLQEMFSAYGLIVMNMDQPILKKAFVPIIKEEIFQTPSANIVHATQERIHQKVQFKAQAYARDINFFYLSPGRRDRIVSEEGQYKIHDTNVHFSAEQLEKEIENFPERFSPNVIMRPLYQESIFPNLAYVGGGGEIAYWIERKEQFHHFKTYFPILVRRNSVLVIAKNIQKTIEKLGLNEVDLLLEEADLIKKYVSQLAGDTLNVDEIFQLTHKAFELLSHKAKLIDPTLESYVGAEASKTTKSIENIESKLRKSIKQKEDQTLLQLSNVKNKLFPHGGLQERNESFWNYYVNEKDDLIEKMIEILNPLEKEFLFFYL